MIKYTILHSWFWHANHMIFVSSDLLPVKHYGNPLASKPVLHVLKQRLYDNGILKLDNYWKVHIIHIHLAHWM